MADALKRPAPRNPVLPLRLPTLPPGARSRAALRMTASVAEGRFELQACHDCGQVQYPPRDACANCLSVRLEWKPVSGRGDLISETLLHHSNELYYRARVPLRLGLVRLDEGVTLLAHLHGDCPTAQAGETTPVRLRAHLDKAGQATLIALPATDTPHMADDRMLREMTSDPKFRKVLVTDGKSATGQALVKSLVEAGADIVWAGVAEPWKMPPGFDAIARLPNVTVVPLELTDARSVEELAGSIGGKVDILVSNADFHRNHGIADRRGTETARAEMDVNYFGLLRLAQSFGPALRARAAEGSVPAAAWVNILSIHALSALPGQGTFSASKAAAFSLSQTLRAEMRAAGIRVVNVFPGPIDDEWTQTVPPPKLAPAALAKAIVKALRDGVEDIYPGDVAQDLFAKWQESAKVLEREMWDQ
ncbi:MAG: SDR family NAD(P)-dependent oxidoreductase [Pseudorhodoplanes sp.]|uniref:SDR family NAD(P)-dependent oxidoreductase n=1 Tax=Pseudorhodoplanes sp. TaxID=1934341 RepID=UPI003D0F8BF8